MLLIAMAGLPGTGKSTLARALATRLDAHVIDKDGVRAALFGATVDYTREQDDLVCRAMYDAVEHLARKASTGCVVLDGRTYSKRYQVDELRRLASRTRARLAIVECTCEPETARVRLETDARHVARNRSFELYRALAAAAEPIAGEKLVLATDGGSVEQLVERCTAWLRERGGRVAEPR
jgi:adenylylsulfate kinase